MILTNCLTRLDDEGSLKAARNLIRNIKQLAPDTKIVTYENQSPLAEKHFQLNKLLLGRGFMRYLRKNREPILYMPLYARMPATSVRIFLLSCFAGRRVSVFIPMLPARHKAAEMLIRLSGARLIFLSEKSEQRMKPALGDRAASVKAGVDVKRFAPVSAEQKRALREKYGIPADKPVVLHVGHMKYGRNIDKLLLIDPEIHAVLVTSESTSQFNDSDLEAKLRRMPNLTIIDRYVPHIEEIYQLSDVYLFPVVADRHCIDSPLSAFEAAACNVPVVTTRYGALEQLEGCEGFVFIDSPDAPQLNAALKTAIGSGNGPRKWIMDYDWTAAAEKLIGLACNHGR